MDPDFDDGSVWRETVITPLISRMLAPAPWFISAPRRDEAIARIALCRATLALAVYRQGLSGRA